MNLCLDGLCQRGIEPMQESIKYNERMRSKIKINIVFIILTMATVFTSCCKCQYTKVDDARKIQVRNHDFTEFTNSKIIYYQDTSIIDTIYLTCDTSYQYLSNAFSLVADEVLNFNYEWELQANDSLSFHFSQFVVKTSTKKSCCADAGVNYLESY